MERRLLRGIANPAMVLTWVFGIWSATLLGVWSDGWLHAKLAFVLGSRLSRADGALGAGVRRGPKHAAGALLRMVNEMPALFMVAIVILVVVKPF